MKHSILILVLAVLLITPSTCNDKGLKRLERYQEQYDVEVPAFSSPVCGNGVCIR